MPRVYLEVAPIVNEYFKVQAKELGTSKSYLIKMALNEQMHKEIKLKKDGSEVTLIKRYENLFGELLK